MPDFVLLTVDSLRFDRATRGYLDESLAVLGRDFAYFSRAYSHGVATPFAFPGIVAGTHPVGDGNVPAETTTLAEAFDGETTGYTNNAHLRPERGYDRGFTRFEESPSVGGAGELSLVDRIARRLQRYRRLRESELVTSVYNRYLRDPLPITYVPADGMTELVRRRLSTASDEFVWGHWMDPHLPYHPETAVDPPETVPDLDTLDDIKERIADADASDLSDDELQLSRELYDANVRYYDRHFADLLRWMRDQPWYDDAMVAVVSDHGELFGEHGQLFHTWDVDPEEETVHTPLWVKYPGGVDSGTRFDHVVGHGDILATVADTLGLDATPTDHTAPLREQGNRHVVSVSNTAKRLVEPDGVYVTRRDGSSYTDGSVSDAGRRFTESITLPECRNSEGQALGVDEAERRRRLGELGYR